MRRVAVVVRRAGAAAAGAARRPAGRAAWTTRLLADRLVEAGRLELARGTGVDRVLLGGDTAYAMTYAGVVAAELPSMQRTGEAAFAGVEPVQDRPGEREQAADHGSSSGKTCAPSGPSGSGFAQATAEVGRGA